MEYANTISGLLTKRAEIMQEMARLREAQAELSNDVEAIDRVLEALGHGGTPALATRTPRIVLFYRGELRSFVTQALATGPLTTRQLAENLIECEGKDARDRRMLADVTRRIGKSLRLMMASGYIQRRKPADAKHYVWFRAEDDPGGW